MKKLFLILLVLPFILGSCSKDDDNSLDGTTWELYENEDGSIYKVTVTFSKTTFSASGYEEYNGHKYEFSETGTYTYDHPNVYFKQDGETYTGTISGNKLTLGDEVYTKK